MSELNKITEILLNPESFDAITEPELVKMLEKWPWCSTVHMMLLKKLQSANDPAYLTQLNKSAIRIPDRTILFRLIHNNRFSSIAPSSSSEPDKKTEQSLTEKKSEEVVQYQKEESEFTTAPKPAFAEKEIQTERDSLINEFIQKEPRISPREGDFAEAVLIAEKSNAPSFDFVTETLANIYLQQGNKKQAIKIFKQLSLTIPEKSSYFAARIKEIRNPDNRL